MLTSDVRYLFSAFSFELCVGSLVFFETCGIVMWHCFVLGLGGEQLENEEKNRENTFIKLQTNTPHAQIN